jgi:hypothetical protein
MFRVASQPDIDNRRDPRFSTECRAMARVAISVTILDVSANGLRARISLPLAVGTLLKFSLPGGSEHHARIAWHDADVFGCEFMKTLNSHELRRVVEASSNAAPVAISG